MNDALYEQLVPRKQKTSGILISILIIVLAVAVAVLGVEKPIIALLHLDALPGDPGYCGDMKTVTEHARKDLLALQDGGVDGILFANEFSLPYQPVADIAVVSAMAYIIGKLKDEISVPFGVNVVKNPIATIDLGAATGAKFGRSCFSGAYMGEYGVYVSNSGEAIRHRKALGIEDMKLKHFPAPDRRQFFTYRQKRNDIVHHDHTDTCQNIRKIQFSVF